MLYLKHTGDVNSLLLDSLSLKQQLSRVPQPILFIMAFVLHKFIGNSLRINRCSTNHSVCMKQNVAQPSRSYALPSFPKPAVNATQIAESNSCLDIEEIRTEKLSDVSAGSIQLNYTDIPRDRSTMKKRFLAIFEQICWFATSCWLKENFHEILNSHTLHQIQTADLEHMNDILMSMFLFIWTSAANVLHFDDIKTSFASFKKRLSSKMGAVLPNVKIDVTEKMPGFIFHVHSLGFQILGKLDKFLNGRTIPLICTIANILIYCLPFGVFSSKDETLLDKAFFLYLVDIPQLVTTDKFAFIVAIILFILSIFTVSPLTDDMRKRGWFRSENQFESIFVACIVVVLPGLGPSMYLLFRPEVSSK